MEELQGLLPREMVQITLHTPPSFTCCFSDRCRPSQLRCPRKKGLFTPYTPTDTAFFLSKPSFSSEYLQSSPGAARIRHAPRESYARNPGIQAHGSGQEALGARLLCTAVSASVAAYCQHICWIVCLSSNIVPPCPAVVRLSLLTILVNHDGTYLHTDHARLPWSAFLRRHEEVRGPKGGSNPYGRILSGRAALSREFPRN